MIRGWSLTLLTVFTLTATAFAQAPLARFRWHMGQTLDYRVEQNTTVTDTAEQRTETVTTKLNLYKRWQVLSVDSAGVASMQMTLLALRMETRKPDGTSVVFDSQKPDPANAELNKEMLQYIGKPIAVLRIGARGQVLEVKESKFGPASRFSAELPFRITLPETAPMSGQGWERTYQIKMEPPQGAGETYNAIQKYTCKNVTTSGLVVALSTTVKDPPDAPIDRIPLVPLQPEGTVTFDMSGGRMKKAELRMAAEFTDHRGDGSTYVYNSTYIEQLVEK